MNKENRELLEQVINLRLKEALENSDDRTVAFEEAMKAIDRQLKMDDKEFEKILIEMKNEFEKEKEKMRQEFELEKEERRQEFEMTMDENDKEFQINMEDKKERFELDKIDIDIKRDSKNRRVKYLEIGATVLLAPVIDASCKRAFAKLLCEFEKDYSFTTMAGKSLSGLFKFKK